jgi:hypothetical protein
MTKRYILNAHGTIRMSLDDKINRRLTGVVAWVGEDNPKDHVNRRLKEKIDTGKVRADSKGLFILDE